ncbi:MAG: nucleotidyl transferase AbiEii/AbiGii toxin family protein [Rhizobiales bacterium]|nr:nucleotidyl transferase AbiEii/AbiGii toxin family protein [Hyphomicrobiales bacterium]
MPPRFEPRIDILPEPQRRLWPELRAVPDEFVLYGGTALALHLGHRESIYFDFFGDNEFDGQQLIGRIGFLSGAVVLQSQPSTLTCLVYRNGPVRLSFFGVPRLKRLAASRAAPDNDLRIAGLPDLAGTKLSDIQMRGESKDYLDVDAILRLTRVGLGGAIICAQAIYGAAFSPQNALKALSYFGDGDVQALPEIVRNRLLLAVKSVELDRLPSLAEILAQHD